MSPNRIKKLKWIYDHDEDEHDESGKGQDSKYNVINIQLLKKISNKELQNLAVLYHYHCNEEDEKENLVVKETIDDDQNGEGDEDDDGKSRMAKDQSDPKILTQDEIVMMMMMMGMVMGMVMMKMKKMHQDKVIVI